MSLSHTGIVLSHDENAILQTGLKSPSSICSVESQFFSRAADILTQLIFRRNKFRTILAYGLKRRALLYLERGAV